MFSRIVPWRGALLSAPDLRSRSFRLRTAAIVLAGLGVVTLVAGFLRSHRAERILHEERAPGSIRATAAPMRDLVQDVVRIAASHGPSDDGNRVVARLQNLNEEGRQFLFHLARVSNPDPHDSTVADPVKVELLRSRWLALFVDAEGLVLQGNQLSAETRTWRTQSLGQTAATFQAALDEWIAGKEVVARRTAMERFGDASPLFHWFAALLLFVAACGALYCEGVRADNEVESSAERRRRIERLELLEGAAAGAPVSLMLIDSGGMISWANPAARSLLGLGGSEAVNRPLVGCLAEPASGADLLRRLGAGERLASHPIACLGPDGQQLPIVLDAQPVFSDGRLSHVWCVARDVSGRLRIEEAWRAGERRLQAILRNLPSGTFLTDRAGACTFANDRIQELAGMSAERIKAGGWIDALHPDDRAAVVEAWSDCVRRGTEFAMEYRFVRPDGSTVWVAGRSAPWRDESGAVVEHVGTVTDVTRLKLTEAEIRDSERQFRSLADNAPVIVWKSDADNRNTFVNRRWLEFRDSTSENERGDGWVRALHPDDREAALGECRAAKTEKRGFTIQYRALRHDGVYRWMFDSGAPEYGPDGDLVGYIGTCVDITDQKEAEERIRRSEERLELAMNGSNEALFDWNVLTGEVYHSPRLSEILGYLPGELSNDILWFRTQIHEMDREAAVNAAREHLKDDVPYEMEFRLRTASGDYRWLRVRGRAIRNERGEPVRMAGSATDVTEQRRQRDELVRLALDATESSRRTEEQAQELARQAEELHAANEKAQAAAKAKGEFLANMSHEIRTPLNAILGMTDLALDGALSDDQRELLRMVHASGEHLLALINDILDFSKIEAGKLDLESLDFDLRECVDLSIQLFSLTAKSKGLELRSSLGDGVPVRLTGDVNRLRQVLVNLIGNAIKFTPAGSVSTDVRLVRCENGRARLHFTVTDTGIGIPADKIDAIFRPFEQADGSTTRQFGGTGLGLSIVRRLVEMMNGRVWVESEPGCGSRFQFEVEMPLATTAAPERDDPQSAERVHTLPPLRVLVAEDNVMNQKLIVRLLEAASHTVTLAADGRQAFEAAARETFDLVLMDMMMPGMSGVEATVAIRDAERRSQKRRVPIVALTANAMQGDREVCLNAGMDGYAVKPIRREQLFGEMARVLFEARSTLESGLSVDLMMQRVDNDLELLGEMVGLFETMAPELIDGLVRAGAERRANDVRHFAHKLRGSTGVFGTSLALATLETIETAARAEPPEISEPTIEAARRQLDALTRDLRALMDESAKKVRQMETAGCDA